MSKLSAQAQVFKEEQYNWFSIAQPPWIKTLDIESEWLKKYCNRFPSTKILFRHHPMSDERNYGLSTSEQYAVQILDRIEHSPVKHFIKAVEGKNEVGLWNEGPLYTSWTIHFTNLVHLAGYQVVGFNFPTGNPSEFWLWKDYFPALSNIDYLGLHEYGNPNLLTDLTWNNLRYRRVYNGSKDTNSNKSYWNGLIKSGYKPKLMITETGIDRPTVDGHDGWQKLTDPLSYTKQLIELDKYYMEDDYLEQSFVFLCGMSDPQWQSFEISQLMPLAEYIGESNNKQKEKPLTPISLYTEWAQAGGDGTRNSFRNHLQNIGKPDFLDDEKYGFPKNADQPPSKDIDNVSLDEVKRMVKDLARYVGV